MKPFFFGYLIGKTLEADQPQYAACRSLLRAGPAASLRMNIRAVSLGLCEFFYPFGLLVLKDMKGGLE